MTTTTKSTSRDDLYDQVWSTPISKLAREYGVSDVGLAKACKRHKIPRPPRGHWAQLRHGKPVTQVPLPSCDDPLLQTIQFENAGKGSTKAIIRDEDIRRFSDQRDEKKARVVVADRLSSPHPLVAATKRKLECTKPGANGIIAVASSRTLRVSVSRKSIGRATCILDAIIKHWEHLGGTVSTRGRTYDGEHEMALGIGNDEVGVTIIEKAVMKGGTSSRKQYYSRSATPTHPSGKFVLAIHGAYGDGIRSTWSDGKRQKLEEVLDSFVEGVIRHIDFNKQRRLDDECESRQEKRARERQAAISLLEKEEQSRRKSLMDDVNRFDSAEKIRRFLRVLEANRVGEIEATDDGITHKQWFAWAYWHADAMDPTVEHDHSPLDDGSLEPTVLDVESLDLTSSTREVVSLLGVRDSDDLCDLTEKAVDNAHSRGSWGTWNEICRVLRGLGYYTSEPEY